MVAEIYVIHLLCHFDHLDLFICHLVLLTSQLLEHRLLAEVILVKKIFLLSHLLQFMGQHAYFII